MTPDVVVVQTLPYYCLETVFATGEKRRFDLKPYVDYPAFSLLKEPDFFMKAMWCSAPWPGTMRSIFPRIRFICVVCP